MDDRLRSATTSAESARPNFWVALARANAVWLLGGVPLLLALIRIVVVSQGDEATLIALAQNLNLKTMFLSTLAAGLPLPLAAVGGLIWGEGDYVGILRDKGIRAYWGSYLLILTGYITVFVAWWALFVVTIFVLMGHFYARGREKGRITRGVITVAIVNGLLGALIYSYSAAAIGIQTERLTMRNGTIRSGYVLNSNDPLTVVWFTGGVAYVKQADLRDRQPCSQAPSQSLASVIGHSTSLCPM